MKDALALRLAAFGQEHLLRFWDELSPCAQDDLIAEIEAVDFAELAALYQHQATTSDAVARARRATPPPAFRLHDNSERRQAARQRGAAALAAGEVGVVLVAGGQGTRLGFNKPKGMYPIGPISQASLFEILLAKTQAVGRRYGAAIPLLLMTSPATHAETVSYLGVNNEFGFAAGDLSVFCQGTMPALDLATGRVLLADKGHLQLSPDGHGGTLRALERNGLLDAMRERGIRQLFYMQIDNPLVSVCDPEFIGLHLLEGSEVSTQVIAKQAPSDRVGNVVLVDGLVQIIEYSDLPDDVAELREPDGSLRFWAGNTAVHVFEVDFLLRAAQEADALPYHLARKKVPYVDASGQLIDPAEPNAIKFERFIFDLLPAAKKAIVVEIDARREFAPVKNAPGEASDSPETVQTQMIALHREWLTAAGARVAPEVAVEISPRFALDAAELAAKIEPGLRVTEPRYFC